MDRATLRERWHGDAPGGRQNKDRPAWVRDHREAIAEHTDTSDPLPPPNANLWRYRRWLASYKGTVTRQLKADGGDADGASDKASGDEAGT